MPDRPKGLRGIGSLGRVIWAVARRGRPKEGPLTAAPNPMAVAFFKNTLRFSAKSLEDAIGGYDKWDEIIKDLKMKDAPASQIAKAEKNKDVSFHILVYVLTGKKHHSIKNSEKLEHEENEFLAQYETEKQQSLLGHLEWIGTSPTLLQGLRTQLHSWPWLAEEADREYVIKRLRKQLKDVNKTKFNFALLEDTENEKGLHEFRREVRWFSFQAGVLNGTVNFYDTFLQNNVPQCPNLELAKLTNPNIHPELTKSPYTKLPQSPFADERICGISRCLYYKISKIVSDVGEIKDRVEKGNFAKEAGNITPPSAVQDVQIIYNDMKTSGVIDHLRDQLKACY